jgi:dTDP-4-amino-4,6-dideoxygalactose transaminase
MKAITLGIIRISSPRQQVHNVVRFVDLNATHLSLREELTRAYERVISRGNFILGEELEAFESEFAEYCGARFCVGVGNGGDALTLCLRAHGIGPGDEVIVPGHTFIATWLSVLQVGARPLPVEPLELTYNIDPDAVDKSITAKTRAIVAVHLYGQPADMERLRQIADVRGIVLVEDAAQAHGAIYRRKKVGSLGHSAAFSFYPTKNLGALGDGGAVTTNDQEIAERLRRLRNYGSRRKYIHEEFGTNSRLDELQAAFLRAKLPSLDRTNERRRSIAQQYTQGLANLPGVKVPAVIADATAVWHLYVIRSPIRDRMAAHLARSNVETLIHYPIPPHLSPALKPYKDASLPLSERISREVLSLPMHPHLTEAQVDHVIHEIRKFSTSR